MLYSLGCASELMSLRSLQRSFVWLAVESPVSLLLLVAACASGITTFVNNIASAQRESKLMDEALEREGKLRDEALEREGKLRDEALERE